MTPRLLSGTFRDFQLLKPNYDKLLSNFASNCILCHYYEVKHNIRQLVLAGSSRDVGGPSSIATSVLDQL